MEKVWKLNINEGDRYGRLTVLQEVERGRKPCGQTFRRFLCKCDCGNTKVIPLFCLRQGLVRSCGCLGNESRFTSKRKYPEIAASSRLYKIWVKMKRRCYDTSSIEYKNYWGRGIAVCDEWKEDFLSFYTWAKSNGYSDKLSLDRINNNGDYEPSNCRWATRTEQANNTSSNVLLSYKGETHTASEWSRMLNIPVTVIYRRRKKKWSDEKILSTDYNRFKREL